MRNNIIDIVHEISLEETSIYTGLFGYDGYDIKKWVNFNYIMPKDNIKDNIKIMLELLLIKVLSESNISKTDITIFRDKEYKILNSNIGFDITKFNNFYDIENHIDDIEITKINDMIKLNIRLPIYNY